MWFERTERVLLAVLGSLLLAGFGTLLWQQRPFDKPLEVLEGRRAFHAARWNAALEAARRVDVNTADTAELERLPGVGPSLAQAIVAHRIAHGGFHRPEDLAAVPGIGPKTIDALREYITTR